MGGCSVKSLHPLSHPVGANCGIPKQGQGQKRGGQNSQSPKDLRRRELRQGNFFWLPQRILGRVDRKQKSVENAARRGKISRSGGRQNGAVGKCGNLL